MASNRRTNARATTSPSRVERTALVLLLVSPVAIVPGGLDRFVFGKLLLAAVAVAVAAFAPARGRLPRGITALIATGAAVLVVAAALSAQPLVALLGRAPRYEGVLVLTLYVLVAWAGARLLGPTRPRRDTTLALDTLAWVAVAVAALAVLEAAGLRPLATTLDRPGSLLGNASDEGALAVLLTGPLAVAAVHSRRPLLVSGAVAAVVTVALSASRGALVGLAVVGLLLAVVRGVRWPWFAATTAAAVALVLAVPATRDRVLGLTSLSAQTVGGRAQLWQETLALWWSHPVLGVGPSGFAAAIGREHDAHWFRTVGPAYPPDSPHTWPLQLLAAGGPLLVLAGIAVVVTLGRATWRARPGQDRWTLGAGIGVLGYVAALLFHFTGPGTSVVALALAAGVVARAPAGGATTDLAAPARIARATPRVVAVAGGGLLAIAFAAGAIAEVLVRSGVDHAAAGDYAAADAAFSSASQLRPWDVDLPAVAAHAVLAADRSGSDPAALTVAGRWLGRAHVHGDTELEIDRATWRERRGDLAGAEAVLTAALADDPENPLLLQQRGTVRAERREDEAAEADLLRVTTLAPASPEPWTNLATLYDAWGRTDDATRARAEARARGGG